MAITAANLSAKARTGWAWRFGILPDAKAEAVDEKALAVAIDAKLVAEIEAQGIVHNIRRLSENVERQEKVATVIKSLVDASDDQLDAVIVAIK